MHQDLIAEALISCDYQSREGGKLNLGAWQTLPPPSQIQLTPSQIVFAHIASMLKLISGYHLVGNLAEKGSEAAKLTEHKKQMDRVLKRSTGGSKSKFLAIAAKYENVIAVYNWARKVGGLAPKTSSFVLKVE